MEAHPISVLRLVRHPEFMMHPRQLTPPSRTSVLRDSARSLFILSSALCLLAGGASAQAPKAAPVVGPESDPADASAAAWSTPTDSQLQSARRETLAALSDLEDFLSSNDAVLRSWQRYLRLAELRSALEAGVASPTMDTAPVEESLRQIAGTADGLELAPFRELRSALVKQRRQERAKLQAEQLAAEFPQRLASAGATITSETSMDRVDEIQTSIQWLVDHGQAPDLAEQAKKRASHPNLYVDVPADTLGKLTLDQVHEVESVRKTEGKATIRGRAVVTGEARLKPVDKGLRVVFEGHVSSFLAGSQGPANFQLGGSTELFANKPVWLYREQFYVGETTTNAWSAMRTICVGSKFKRLLGKLVRRVASKQIAERRSQDSRELSDEVAQSFKEKFDEDVRSQLREGHQDLQKDVLKPLLRLDADPQRFEFRTNPQLLQLALQVETPFGLAAPLPQPPPLKDRQNTLAVRIHQSFIDRLAHQSVRGDMLDIDELLAELSGDDAPTGEQAASEEDKGDEDEVGLKIELVRDDPLRVRFVDNQFHILIRGNSYEVESSILTAMDLEIRYDIRLEDGQWFLTNPRFTIDRPRGVKRGSLRFFAQRNVLKRQLERELPKHEPLEAFDLPEPANVLGKLEVKSLKTDNGWLTATFQPADSDSSPTTPVSVE